MMYKLLNDIADYGISEINEPLIVKDSIEVKQKSENDCMYFMFELIEGLKMKVVIPDFHGEIKDLDDVNR